MSNLRYTFYKYDTYTGTESASFFFFFLKIIVQETRLPTRSDKNRRRETTPLSAEAIHEQPSPRRSVRSKRYMSRPELTAPPQEFYNDAEARKYTASSRVIEIQDRLTERAIELLNFPNDGTPRLLLDVGCGSGLSGDRLTELGHKWIGTDISTSMLEMAQERQVEGGLVHYDMGHGCPFRPGVFDGAISISAVQWLCNADNSFHEPRKRLKAFFTQLYRCLRRGAKAVLQFYPDGTKQAEMITSAALRVGFSGGLVVDYPNSTRAKKYFLVLAAGQPESLSTQARSTASGNIAELTKIRVEGRDSGSRRPQKMKGAHSRTIFMGSKRHPEGKGKKWILKKKEQAKHRGKETARDSKYTGRKRKERT